MSIKSGITGTTESLFTIGDGTSGDKYIYIDNGSSPLPNIRFNYTSTRWELSSDGSSWESIISGNHNSLIGLQGGEEDAYYHMSSYEYDFLIDGYTNGWSEVYGGTGQTTYTRGDVIKGASSSNTLEKLSVGGDGHVMVSDTVDFDWTLNYYNNIIVGKQSLVGTSVDGYLLQNLTVADDEFGVPAFCSPLYTTLSQFRIRVSTACGVGESLTVTVRKNGVDTDLTLTLSDTSELTGDASTIVRISPANRVTFRVETSSNCAAKDLYVSLLCSERFYATIQ